MLKLLPRFSGLAAVMTFVFGVWAIAQSHLASEETRGLASLYVPMVPAAALLFMLLGGAHALYRLDPARKVWRRTEQAAAVGAVAAVVLILSQDVAAFAPGWEAVAAFLGLQGPRPLGRVAPSSGLAFILTAASMFAGTLEGPRARRIAGTCAALGVGLACFGLTRVVVSLPPLLSARPMALMAAAGFILLNLALLLDQSRTGGAGRDPRPSGAPPLSMQLVAATLLTILVASSAGSIYMRQRVDLATATTARELDSIANLKLSQIVAWRGARISEGRYVMRTRPLARDVANLLAAPDNRERRARLADWLMPLLSEGRSRGLALVAPDGRILYSIPETAPRSTATIPRRGAWTDVFLGDVYRAPGGALALDLVVPVGGAVPTAFIVFDIDPTTTIFPLLETSPLPVKSLESTLSRREGGEVVFVSEALARPGSALTLRYPVAEPALPEARAARGESQTQEAVDYRGVPVLATSRAVPDSPWTMTTKVDQQELYAPAQEDASHTALFVIVFLFGLIGFAAYIGREQSALALETALRAERERAATAERLAALMKGANDMILLFDDAGRIVDVNDRVIEAYGYRREELIGSSVARLRADADEAAVAAHRAALSTKGGWQFSSQHRRKDGSTFPVDVSGRAVEIDGRTVVMAIYRDVTERQAQDEALRRSEERLRLLGDNLPDSYLYQIVLDEAGSRHFVYASSGIEKLHGIQVADLLLDPALLHRQTVPEDLERLVAAEAASLREMKDFAIEIRIRRADGDVRWLHIRSRPRPAGNGAVVWDGVAADVTLRKKAEESLRQVQSAVKESPVSILIADIDGTIRYVNPAFTRVTGFTSEEAIGRNPRELLGDENDPAMHADVEECLRTGRLWEGVFRNRKKNGEVFWEHTRIAPVPNESGVFASYVAVKEDITARLAAERALRDSESKLAEAIDVAHLGCYETWEEAGRVEVDDRIAQMLGTRATTTAELRDHWVAHIHPEDLGRILPKARAFWSGVTERFEDEYRYRRSEFDEIWVSQATRVVDRAPDGKVRRTIGVVKDITAEKAATEAVRRSEERHRLLADNASDVIWTTDTEGRMTYVSPSVERLRGYAPAELVGCPFAGSVTEEHQARLAEMFTEAVAEFRSAGDAGPRRSQRFEVDQPCKDGTFIHTEVTASPMFDSEHHFIGVLGVTRDITARHAADQALKDSEFRLQMAIETAQLGIIELRDGGHAPDGIACDILGLDPSAPADIIPTWLSRIHAGDLERVRAIREDFLTGRRRGLSIEYRYVHPIKGQVWVSHSSRALESDAQGRTIRAVVVVKDITAVRRAEEDLRNLAATRAQQLDELRRWQQAMLGREDRIQELKREANALAKAAGREVPYPSQEPVA